MTPLLKTPRRFRIHSLLLAVGLGLGGDLLAQTRIALRDGQWIINDHPTNPGGPAQGLLLNVCIVVPEWNLILARTNGGRKDGAANTPTNVNEVWSGSFERLAPAIGRPPG